MKILFIHPRLSVFGGAERVLVHMLKALAGNELGLLTDCWNPDYVKEISDVEPPNVEWIRCLGFRPSFRHLMALQWWLYASKLNRLIREVCGNYDLLIETQEVYSDPRPGVPLVNYIHYPNLAIPSPEERQGVASSVYYALLRFLIRRRVRKISLALTNSSFTARKIVASLKIKPLVVPPPIDVKKFYSNRSWLDREDKVVSVGTFIPFKRHHLLFDIARKLRRIHFVIIGTISEDYRSYYEKLFTQKPDNVAIMHDVTFDEVRRELASAKVYVHLCPEHFGISVVEAAAAGSVPIVYYMGGPAECMGDTALRWKNSVQLCEYIRRLIENRNLWSKLSQRAKMKASEFDAFTFEQRIRSIIASQPWK